MNCFPRTTFFTAEFRFWMVSLIVFLTVPRTVRAADTWSTPHPGIRLLTRTTSVPQEIFALEVDTCARGISHRATTESERQRTPTSFRSLTGAQAVINGDFFNYTDYFPISLAVGNGTTWHSDISGSGFLAAGHDNILISPVGTLVSTLWSWVRQAVGGRPTLVWNGSAQYGATDPDHCTARHPRTAVGLSRDRQYLYLVIVDGRTSASLGMTCNELADLMVDLGAFTAINLDGGGSSAMSVAGLGTVNNPSDGSERVVSNHWAVFASGSGAPDSCDLWMDEIIVDSAQLSSRTNTDVDGDGRADFCARGASGFRCWISQGSAFDSAYWLIPEMADSAFGDEMNFSTIRLGDINGDGLADVCGRSADGIRCYPSTGSGFAGEVAGPSWADSVGWGQPQYATSFRLADIDGDGLDDFCALAAAGFICYPSTGSGIGYQVQGPAWTAAGGWHDPSRYGTIRMGDLNGDGKADVCARAADGMVCAISEGNAFSDTVAGPSFSDARGFTGVAYWSTIRMLDLDGDGLDDLCARTDTGVECYRSLGDGTFGPLITGPELSDAMGWKDMDNATTIRFADIDGDGDQDLCARANAGIRCWTFDGTGFAPSFAGPLWDDASGWNDFRLYTSIQMGDVNGDGRADICGRNGTEVTCHLSDGAGFPTAVPGPTMRDADGWSAYKYFSTIRFGGVVPLEPACEPVAMDDTTCDGLDDDCDGFIDEDADGTCDDGDPCNGTETCSGSGCVPGDAPDCGDRGCVRSIGCCPEGTTAQGDACVGSTCDPANDDCDDGDVCNGVEVCDDGLGQCVAGAAPDCGDRGCVGSVGCCPVGTTAQDGICMGDACDPNADNCTDGDVCNGIEVCDAILKHCVVAVIPSCGDRGCLPDSGCCPEGTTLEGDQCMETSTGSSNAGGGCGCRTAGGTPRSPMAVGGFLLLAWVLIRRRTSAR